MKVFQDRRHRHTNNWLSIIYPANGMDIQFNKHQPCPNCGGTNRFRCDDRQGSGSYICGQCGAGDGYTLLMKVHNCSFVEALTRADEALGSRVSEFEFLPARNEISKQSKPTNLLKLMSGLLPPEGTPVETYLNSRGLSL